MLELALQSVCYFDELVVMQSGRGAGLPMQKIHDVLHTQKSTRAFCARPEASQFPDRCPIPACRKHLRFLALGDHAGREPQPPTPPAHPLNFPGDDSDDLSGLVRSWLAHIAIS